MKKILLMQILFTAVLFAVASCSDDDVPGDPDGTITLNMLNEANGKTMLGTSDVYINEANNFYSSSCLIAEGGSASGLGTKAELNLNGLVQETAVTQGHIYLVFESETIRAFPSGVRAVMLGSGFYRVYVVSPITVDNNQTGAVVKYVLLSPDSRGLPEYGHLLGELNHAGGSVSLDLPADAECLWYDDISEVFNISTDGGKLVMSLNVTPTETNGITGYYEVYIRSGNVFTKVKVLVSR